ncbi:MAG: DUF86 domain-containing protein [Candidatus Deferrimicrobium sp.]|nr:DUF86 domain-containing protein [Candidatus Deferrimicrobium sp.]MDO8738792.1 DUF86 domain-containing protein [Candidatus Deferrimicrobium sp.]
MSDRREVRDYLSDILQAIGDIRSYTTGMTVDAFRKDRKTQQAVIRCLEVVGEATEKIPPAFRDRHPETPWQEIAGMRDKLIHEYFGVDLDIVWETTKEDLVPFETAVLSLLATLGESS